MANPENFDSGAAIVSRSIFKSAVFQNAKWLKVWLWCILRANFQDTWVPVTTGKGETIVEVKRGQFIFGRFKSGEALNMAPTTVRDILNKFKAMKMIATQTATHYTIITVCNYDDYQDFAKYLTPGKPPPNRHPTATDKKPKKVLLKSNTKPKMFDPKKRTKQPLPVFEDWQPNDTLIAFAKKEGYNEAELMLWAEETYDWCIEKAPECYFEGRIKTRITSQFNTPEKIEGLRQRASKPINDTPLLDRTELMAVLSMAKGAYGPTELPDFDCDKLNNIFANKVPWEQFYNWADGSVEMEHFFNQYYL